MNPILIRHLYESVRRNRFFWFLSLYLLSIGVLALLFMSVMSVSLFGRATTSSMLNLFTAGRVLYWFSSVILILTANLIVPLTALGAFAGERENRTLDLLVTTTLPPHAIVLGKLASAWITGAVYVLAPLPLLMAGFWLGGVTTPELIITLLLLALTMLVNIAGALFISSWARRTIAAVFIFYGLALASIPVFGVLEITLAGLSQGWRYSNFMPPQPLWIEALIQYGWVLVAGLHPLTAAIITEQMIFEQDAWLLLHFTVTRPHTITGSGTLGSLVLPSPWITFTFVTLIVTAVLLYLTMRRLGHAER